MRIRFLFSSDAVDQPDRVVPRRHQRHERQLPGPCTTDLCSQVVCDDGDPCTTDACDAVDGQCDFTPPPTPTEVGNSLGLGKTGGTALLTWSDGGNPGTFGVYRGTHPSGVPWDYNQQCLGAVAGTSTSDGAIPASQASFFYLITRKTACGESVAGRDSGGNPVPNDDPCP